MARLHVTWGKHKTFAKPNGPWRGKFIFSAKSVVFYNDRAIYEQLQPVETNKVEIREAFPVYVPPRRDTPSAEPALTERPASMETVTASKPVVIDRPQIEATRHEEQYELPAGTEVVLWVDQNDTVGRFANFPAWIVCQLLDEPVTPENTVTDNYGKIAPVKVLRIEHRESASFMNKVKP